MTLTRAKQVAPNYYAVVEHAQKLLPENSSELTVRQTAWLYIQYGCNTYTDGPGFPFKPEDARDALPVTKREGMALVAELNRLGILEELPNGRYRFAAQWI
jgi:hypothetical protein